MVQAGFIAATNIYRDDDKPKYRRGNRVLVAVNVLSILIFVAAKAYYVIRNKQRDKKWKALSREVSCPPRVFIHTVN